MADEKLQKKVAVIPWSFALSPHEETQKKKKKSTTKQRLDGFSFYFIFITPFKGPCGFSCHFITGVTNSFNAFNFVLFFMETKKEVSDWCV